MTRDELAAWLCDKVRARRLERIGEPDDHQPQHRAFVALPDDMQQPWLDVADAVLELLGEHDAISRLQKLGADWLRYTITLNADPAWRDEMRRGIVSEMRVQLARMETESGWT